MAEIVLFDSDCPPCVQLARWAEKRAAGNLTFAAWDDFRGSAEGAARLEKNVRLQAADRLRVLTDSALLEGDAAWRYLVAAHPSLKSLDWLAAKLGLSPLAAKALRTAGEVVRRFCASCPRRSI